MQTRIRTSGASNVDVSASLARDYVKNGIIIHE